MKDDSVLIRPARVTDATKLLSIYEPYIKESTITFEEIVPTREEFKNRMKKTLQTHPFLVAEEKGIVVGYVYAHFYNSRSAYQRTAESTIYVQKDKKRNSIGCRLSQVLEKILVQQGVRQVLACVTAENSSSISFHQKCGYQIVGKFSKVGYKMDHWCDIVWLQKELPELPDQSNEFIPFAQLKVDI